MSENEAQDEPTMIYAPGLPEGDSMIGIHGPYAVPVNAEGQPAASDVYVAKVVPASEVEQHCQNGWFTHFNDFPRRKGRPPKSKESETVE